MEPATDINKDPGPAALPPVAQPTANPAHDSALVGEKTHKVLKTTGEKWFDAVRFATGEGVILGLTAVLAYASKYGKPSYLGMPNIFKSSEEWMTKKLMPKDEGNEFKVRLAGAIAGTTVLMHGGNLFVPVMKGLQNNKAPIVAYFNEKFGKPGEVEAGNERLKHETKESWGDIIKGRIASWATVFAGFFAADMVAGKHKFPDGRQEYRFDIFKDWVGRKVAGLTKEGKEIAKTPVSEMLTKAQFENKSYRFGKILALDVFATTAALAIWHSVSKFSAIMRGRKGEVAKEAAADLAAIHTATPATAETPDTPAADLEKKTAYAARIGERPVDFRSLAEKEPASGMALSQ